MRVDPDNLIRGIRGMAGGISGAATKSGVSRQNLSEVVNGKRGLSLDTSRRVCKSLADGPEPFALYIASHVRSIKQRRPLPGEVMAAAMHIVKTLEAERDEIRQLSADELDELNRHVNDLGELTNEAIAASKSAPQRRDGVGLVVEKRVR